MLRSWSQVRVMGASTSSFSAWLSAQVQRTEAALERCLPASDTDPVRLHQAMRYAVLGGGKRVRAALVFGAAEAVAAAGETASSALDMALDSAAVAVELIHAYSLVHDDLPSMDNDHLRRGKPTVHVQFDEATALLAGDALQPLAFQVLAQMPVASALVVQAIVLLARSAGSTGMAGGQAIDCESAGRQLNPKQLQTMHALKTGAMLQASVQLGGVVMGASSRQRESLQAYADAVGLAFQVADDILDVVGDTATLGKTAGKDAANNKPTYVSLLGLEGARNHLDQLHEQAKAALLPLGQAGMRLAQLADFIVGRNS